MTDSTNPFFETWATPFGAPPFDRIRPEHYRPAVMKGMAMHQTEIDAIIKNTAPATFENTLLPLEQAGSLLSMVGNILSALTMAATSAELQELDAELSPLVSTHYANLFQNQQLFARLQNIYASREQLAPQAKRLVENYHRSFIESGAALNDADKQRFISINSRLSELYAVYRQNTLAEEQNFQLELESEDDRAGLPSAIIDAAAAMATSRNMPGNHLITLAGSLRGPFMTYSARRDLRQKVHLANADRGRRGGANDNQSTALEVLRLRAELGQLLGYENYAAYTLENSMAKSPAGAKQLLQSLWSHAIQAFETDQQAVQELARTDGITGGLQAWDWSYYADKLRQRELNFRAEEVRPYLTIDNVLQAAFYTAHKLFNINFVERHDVPTYDPDVRVWEIQDKQGHHVALYYGDFYARHNKLGGGWMGDLRNRNKLWPTNNTPIVYNVCNFNKPEAGKPGLLSLGDMETVFHELGHVLHEALSLVDYPSLGGRNVLRDFVELPSQLMEHWAVTDEILEKFARHYGTGETIPTALRKKIRAAQTYRQSAGILSYLASCLLDISWHELSPDAVKNSTVQEFENKVRSTIGLPPISHFYSTTANLHMFDGPGYAASYYIYIWAQVLDADAFEAFEEAGDLFHPATAARLLEHIYSAGNSDEPGALYEKFRGRPADPEALIRKLGFVAANSAHDGPIQKPTSNVQSTNG